MKTFVGYVPVIHAGYTKLFWKDLLAHRLLFLDGELLSEPDYLSRDVRACRPEEIALMSQGLFGRGEVVSNAISLIYEVSKSSEVVMPDEDVSHVVADKYLNGLPVKFLSTWLRWDKISTTSEKVPNPGRVISQDDFDLELIGLAFREADKSSDWWRQIGGVLVDDGRVLMTAFNRHQPTDYTPYIDGDPRGNFNFGERFELSNALHAEAAIISRAAKNGLSTEGKSLYVTTFPCPGCANSIKESGIKKLYYRDGYSLVAANEILAAHVEIIKVVSE